MNSKIRAIILSIVGVAAVGGLATAMATCFGGKVSSPSEQPETSLNSEEEETPSGAVKEEQLSAESWADSIMATLSPRKRVAQLFVPRWDINNGTVPAALMRKQIDEGIGGFLLGKGPLNAYVDIINKAQSMAQVPLLVTLDGEWGLSMRIPEAPRFPKNIALGAIQDSKLLEEYGREVARECKLTGIQVDFAPVLDVNSNPSNPVIGYRSFGEDPKRVAELGAAFCKGMEQGGVMSVGKHFPGHGDTSVDSHKALPTVDHSKQTLETVDFVPFVAAKNAGMSGVMVGHLRVPALDKSGTPSSLSKIITTDVLQKQLGFDGLIFTDALTMKGAANANENNHVSAFRAGADVLLGTADLAADIQAMMNAIKAGTITQAEVDRRCRKLLIYKYKLGLVTPAVIKKEGLAAKLNSPECKALLDRLAKASVTVVRNDAHLLPLENIDSRKIAVVSLGATPSNEFAATCRKYAAVETMSINNAAEIGKAVAEAKKADVVVVGVFKNDAAARSAFARLVKECRNVVPVFFINPFKMSGFGAVDKLPTLVVAYDDTKELFSAGAQAVFGGIDVTGRFPVNIKGVAKIGDGVDLKKKD
ncbi:MAG: glycoside hydrolase family 3 protein [Firmicutes bacterium]|nr:glycoside hydrolase family 3 protein [Bacillota bacterium]MCM1400661.1 glycoside hydrolase family 3 protein [Bacteroides sp.]MCM1476352.1 glycoside hydrolase family 3 protein [Bacteroides sp.]